MTFDDIKSAFEELENSPASPEPFTFEISDKGREFIEELYNRYWLWAGPKGFE